MNTDSSGSAVFRVDFRLPGPSGDLLLEVKRTSSSVDLRGALLSLAYVLAGEATSRAVCVLVVTRLTQDRLQKELGRFRWTAPASLADRVFVLGLREGRSKAICRRATRHFCRRYWRERRGIRSGCAACLSRL